MYKASMVFEQNFNSGWTELLYSTRSTALAVLSDIQALAAFRARMLGNSAQISAVKVKNLEAPFEGNIVRTIIPGNASFQCDTPWQAIHFEIVGTGGNKRSYKCPGLPDEQSSLGQYLPSGPYAAIVNQFLNQLPIYAFCIRVRDKSQPRIDVVSVDNTGLLTTVMAHGFAVGDQVRFFRSKDTVGFPITQTFNVTAIPTLTTAQLHGWQAGRLCNKGQVYDLTFVAEAIATTGDPAMSLRKVGRPFDLLRGRRSAQH